MKTIIDPKYEPYKKPDNKDNQEAGSINKTITVSYTHLTLPTKA